jgi:hypothetical protein
LAPKCPFSTCQLAESLNERNMGPWIFMWNAVKHPLVCVKQTLNVLSHEDTRACLSQQLQFPTRLYKPTSGGFPPPFSFLLFSF